MFELFELLGSVDWKKPGAQDVSVLETVRIRRVKAAIDYPDSGFTHWKLVYAEGFDVAQEEVGEDVKGVPFTTRKEARRFLREKVRPWRERYRREKEIIERVESESAEEE